ncbi:hypothetical protein KC19_5G003700 [Ceratodon purpureus]|uniref:Uncharacterized protein n=1 Tax=Ceratodon purpureus TaxID=3225 RepID=A0A8T0HWJ5_CERPU|nr:hypothetical protein KC19_5G003700 [Ceratodon purpureus]
MGSHGIPPRDLRPSVLLYSAPCHCPSRLSALAHRSLQAPVSSQNTSSFSTSPAIAPPDQRVRTSIKAFGCSGALPCPALPCPALLSCLSEPICKWVAGKVLHTLKVTAGLRTFSHPQATLTIPLGFLCATVCVSILFHCLS